MRRVLWSTRWLGFALTLAGLGFALASAVGTMRPGHDGKAEDFWERVYIHREGDDLLEYRRTHWRWTFLTSGGTYAYAIDSDPGHPWRGQFVLPVPETEVRSWFPNIIDQVLANSGKGITNGQMAALLGHETGDKGQAIEELRCRKEEIGQSRQAVERFVLASDCALLEAVKAEEQPAVLASKIDSERMFVSLMQRAQRYWMNVAFEAALLTALATVFWLPILWGRIRRLLPLFWGMIPLLLFAPYALGYCPCAFAFMDRRVEGVLYPSILQVFLALPIPLRTAGESWLACVPPLLDSLNQPLGRTQLLLVASVGPVGPIVMGIGMAAIAWLGQTIGRRARQTFLKNPADSA